MPTANEYMWVKRREWDNLVAKVNSIGFPDGTGLAHHTPRQVALSARGSGGSECFQVRLTAKTDDTTYVCNVYRNGVDLPATDTGVVIRVREIAAGETIRFGVTFAATMQPWPDIADPTKRKSYLTLLEIPRLI
jgi:hypothetical protein